jgi:predicted dehydrogenase
VACADLRPEVMAAFGHRYGVLLEHQYTDYRELLEKERPEIVSVATQPEQRAEIVIAAAESGVQAIYAEKAMAASLAEADAMVAAVEKHGVAFNLGTNRRWDTGFDKMKEVIDIGSLGALRSILIYSNGTLFNMSSHWFDLALGLNSDRRAIAVQSHLPDWDNCFDGEHLHGDPTGEGTIWFENGVTCYVMLTSRSAENEAICERGTLTALNNGSQWQMRLRSTEEGPRRGKLVEQPFPPFERTSSTANLIADLVHSLDTGEPTRCGGPVARASTELIFAFMESHRRGGARIELPLKESSLRLERKFAPRQPRFTT